jgi:hypothetical protein
MPKRLLIGSLLAACAIAQGARFSSVVVRTGSQPDSIEENAARILKERLSEPAGLAVRVERENEAPTVPAGALVILLGTARSHAAIAQLIKEDPPFTDPEGFVLKTVARPEGPLVVAAGVDTHGVLYAVGEILRRADVRRGGLEFPVPLAIRTAPAFEVRGTQFGQSSVALQKGKVRRWTLKDQQRKVEDYALAGLNTVEFAIARQRDPMYQFLQSMGIRTLVSEGPNIGSGPPEWKAWEAYGRPGYLCPSVPAAREALIKRFEERYRNSASMDYVRFKGGDGGGCECDRCRPYGRPFMLLCEEMAEIVHRYHPKAQIMVANQKFDNESDQAIFDYLREKPRPWVRAFCYGPGSDAMGWQPGHRQNHRMDLFRYPGFGPFDRYVKEILHQLPPEQDIIFFNELTHSRGSQYGYIGAYPRADRDGNLPPHWNHRIYERREEPAFAMVYDRLTFFAWPRYYHWIFGETVRYGSGDVTHSSGTQDQFNQWMWQRLMWSPQRGVEDVVDEYARTWFGPEAAPLMAQAVFQLEENFEEDPKVPLERKAGIDRYLRLVREAGARMPAWRMRDNWLWREYMQKALIDKHIQLDRRRQLALKKRIEVHIAAARPTGNAVNAAIAQALIWLKPTPEPEPMRLLRQEALRLGEESNTLFGVRSDALFNLDHDFVGLGWLRRELERARAATGDARSEMLDLITDYENPGAGGFYDDAGSFPGAPHVVHGQPYTLASFSEENRPSQRTLHFTQDDGQGVTLRYTGLDPTAAYRIRFSFVRPRYQDRHKSLMPQKTQTIYAGGIVLARELEIPEYMSEIFSFDIPAAAIDKGGELVIRFEKAANLTWGSRVEREVWRNTDGWGTLVSDVWLIKKKPERAAGL